MITPGPADTSTRQYPPEYFAAPIEFALRIAALSGLGTIEALERYTGLYREVIGAPPAEGACEPRWADLVGATAHLTDPATIAAIVYAAYCAQPHSAYDPGRNGVGARIFGALGYRYDPATAEARIHFFPQRAAVSDLASVQVPQRRDDFRRLLLDLRQHQPAATAIRSSTWLQNLPNYRALFPPTFTARLTDIGGSSYLGVWGQFVRGDGGPNLGRLAEFRADLARAATVDDAINAIPLKVLEGVGPVGEFYAAYGIDD